MEKVGDVARRVLKDVEKRARNIGESTPSPYKCQECRKPLTPEELDMNLEVGLQGSVFGCTKHLRLVAGRERGKRIAWIGANIGTIMTQRDVPGRYLTCSLENFMPIDRKRGEYLRRSRVYIERNVAGMGRGMFLTGPNGTGKTHLAVGILRELSLTKGCLSWYFIKVPQLLMTIRQAFKDGFPDSEANLIKRFVDYDYLVIDELGVEKTTEWGLQTLYLIVDGRSDELKQTIITSNLTLQDIEDKLDPRLASRIVGMSEVILELECEDWRLTAKKRKAGQPRK